MVIDTHAHIYTSDSDQYPIIDKPYTPPAGSGSPEGLIAEMDAAGVDKVMMVQTTTYYGWDNSFMRDTVPRYSDRARRTYYDYQPEAVPSKPPPTLTTRPGAGDDT